MRVTNNMLVNNLITNVNRNLLNMTKMQDQLATGKKVHTASDDPVAASKIIKYRTDISEYSQYERNTSDALSWLETTESTMMNINTVIQRARELSVRAATGTNSDDDVKKIGDELKQLRNQLIMDANFSFAGRYIFSGYHTEEKLFNDDGTFNIGMTDIDINRPPTTMYQIGVGEEIKISSNGLEIFGYTPDDDIFVDAMPGGRYSDASGGKPKLTSDFSFNTNYKELGPITLDIDGQTFNVVMTDLDLSEVDITKDSEIDTAKEKVVSAIENAVLNPVTDPPTLLSEFADVYFTEDDQLVVMSKNNTPISMSQTTGTSFGLSMGEYSYDFPLNADYTAGGPITIEVNGKGYDVDITNLDLSAVDLNNPTEVENAKNFVIGAIMNSASNPATVPQTYFSDEFSAYFDSFDQLVISGKNNEAISITQSIGTSLGLLQGKYVTSSTGGESESGIASYRAELKSEFELDQDYTALGQITIDINGQTYDLSMTDLDLSGIDTTKIADVTSAKSIIIKAIKEAAANPATVPQTSISDVADVYFDENDKLTIRYKEYGEISMSQTTGTSLGLSFGEYNYDFPLDADYTAGGPITIDVNGYGFDVDITNLDLSGVDLNDQTQVDAAKADVIDALMNGAANPATAPQTYFKDNFEAHFNEFDKLVISAKNNDAINVTQSAGTSLGLIQGKSGNDLKDATVSTGVITDAEVGTNFNGRQFDISVNGVSERITIGNVAEPQNLENLVAAFQSAIDSKLGTGAVVVSESGRVITFSTNGTSPDGEAPALEIHPVIATKSKMIQDFDDVIKAIETGDREGVNKFIGIMDENLEVILTGLSDIGARTNRMELVVNRINENSITFTKLLSNAQDADMSEVIMYLKNSENVYRASLSTGAKVIQPSLIDFLR